MDKLELGRMVVANFTIGRHPGIVLSTKEEIEDSGMVFVVAISANKSISHKGDLIEVPSGLGTTKECFVQCGVTELLRVSEVTAKSKKAYGPFLEKVQKQVRAACDRAKKSMQK